MYMIFVRRHRRDIDKDKIDIDNDKKITEYRKMHLKQSSVPSTRTHIYQILSE